MVRTAVITTVMVFHPKNSSVCYGHGDCIDSEICSCNPAYTGNYCEQSRSCYGVQFDHPSVCSGRGQCSSMDNCLCNLNWTGMACEIPICNGLWLTALYLCAVDMVSVTKVIFVYVALVGLV